MLLNYLRLSLRLLGRNLRFTILNVLGLSIGITTFYILWQYSQFELKSDQFHTDYERIVRSGFVLRTPEDSGGEMLKTIGLQHLEVARRMAIDFDEIETLTRIINQENFRFGGIPFHNDDIIVSIITEHQEKVGFRENKVAYGDPNLFTFFNLPLILGKADEVLTRPYTMVLSESAAEKYFGKEDPIGKTLTINDSLNLVVTGVFKNIPHNSHLDFQMVISTLTLGNSIFQMTMANSPGVCYFKLHKGVDVVLLDRKIDQSYDRYWGELARQLDQDIRDYSPFLQPLQEIPFSVYHADYFVPKSKVTLVVFALVGVVILVMAWINYLNLTLSFNHRRLKEFAARKTLGAKSTDLIAQFLVESIIINVLALLFAFTLFQLINQPLEVWLGFYIPGWGETSLQTIAIIAITVMSGILFTGIYPALLTYRNTPRSLFRMQSVGEQRKSVSRWLTVSQYVGAITLIIWTFAIVLQLNFMLNRDLGISKEDVLVVDLPFDTDYTSSGLSGFTHFLSQNKNVVDYAVSRSVAGDDPVIDVCLRSNGKNEIEDCGYTNGGVDERFLPFYNIKLLAGRNFISHSGEEKNILVDMNAIEFMGLQSPEQAIGRELQLQDAWPNAIWYPVKIVGVIETFSLRPLSQRLIFKTGEKEAIVLTYKHLRKADTPKKVSVRLAKNANQNVIQGIEASFHQFFPGGVFNSYFLDEHISRHYLRDRLARNQITFVTGLAIFVACLGLFGMMVNQAMSKVKELGIRKVLGAGLHQLTSTLLKSTANQVLIAIGISIPISYFLVKEHLSNFIERIELQWWHYALPVLMLVLIMLGTVAGVVWKAARSNPVEALKYE